MNGRRAVIGLCMLCALTISAVAAQGASASGTTAYTCTEGAGEFTDAHCTTGGSGGYAHVAIPANTTTELSVTNANTCGGTTEACPFVLTSVAAGIKLQLKATTVTASGTVVNEQSGEEMFSRGNPSLTFEGVTVTAPAGKGCVVETTLGIKEKIVGEELYTTTLGQGMTAKFEPTIGTVLWMFKISGCSAAALNKNYVVEGSIKGAPNGATITFAHNEGTEQGTLTLSGQKAGLAGSLTFSARANSSEAFAPIAFTT